MSHTPGPWTWSETPHKEYASVWLPGTYECEVYAATQEETRANAILMAAAPDMLHALYVAYAALAGPGVILSSARAIVDAAVRKATGSEGISTGPSP